MLFEVELSHSLFQTFKVSLDRLEENIYTLVKQGFNVTDIDQLDFWRYENFVDKTIEWFEAIKEARENSEKNRNGQEKMFEINSKKSPDEWNLSI